MKLWVWRASWNYDGSQDSKSAIDICVVAPDLVEALRLVVQNPPSPVPNEEPYYIFVLIGIARQEKIVAQWKPIIQGPKAPTLEEQAMAETEALIGE